VSPDVVTVMRASPLLALALSLGLPACGADTSPVGSTDKADGGDTGDQTSDDCADEEVPYNGVDDDCDPETPDDDLDGDGYGVDEDCEDEDAAINPGATEECNDVDDDCDGVTDPEVDWYADVDGDGWGGEGGSDCEPPEDSVSQGGDCDDTDGAVNPGATEVCNGVDDDCDEVIDGVTEGYGEWEACPAVDCKDLLAVVPDAADGTFWIGDDADSSTDPFEARCDMATDGGGWTMILSLNASGMTQYDAADVLESKQVVGALGDDNHLSEAFYRVSFDESYVGDTTHGTPVISDSSWGGGTVGDEIDTQLSGSTGASSIWSHGSRSALQVRSSETTDSLIAEGDMRVHFMVDQDDTADLAFPVTTEYRSTERHLIFDSDYGYAGGRIYDEPLYDVASVGVDEVFEVFVR